MNIKKKKSSKMLVIAFGVCLSFLVGGLLFVMSVMQQSDLKEEEYLNTAARQVRDSVANRMTSDLMIMRGVAINFSVMDISDHEHLIDLLAQINNSISFVRMGYANLDGMVDLVDMSGKTYTGVDLSGYEFFQQARAGHEAVAPTFFEELTQQYVNYYAVPVLENGVVKGVLCAVNQGDVLKDLIDQPVLLGRGFTCIVTADGTLVGPTRREQMAKGQKFTQLGTFSEEQSSVLHTALAGGKQSNFSGEIDGKEHLVSVQPLEINDWFILSALPVSSTERFYDKTAVGVAVLVFVACLIFVFLIERQRRLMLKNQIDLETLAFIDPLTGVRNYTRFMMDAEKLIQTNKTGHVAIWFFDIKQFKNINTIFGYTTGDRVLQRIAVLLEKDNDESNFFCHITADRFVGIRIYQEKKELEEWFQDLLNRMSDRKVIPADQMQIDLSVGFYCLEEDAAQHSVNDLVNCALMAGQKAKEQIGSVSAFFVRSHTEDIRRETQLVAASKAALAEGDITFYLQPKVNIQGGCKLFGAEALARWNSKSLGMIYPGEFVPLFERNGFIVKMDRYIFNKACQWLAAYLAEGNPPINLAVNLSRLGMQQKDCVEYYVSVKNHYKLPDGILELEMTESVMLDNYGLFRSTVEKLRTSGFLCAIDDFGSGYSSLNVLKNLEIDVLKLDAVFFREETDVAREQVMVASLIQMAHQLRIRVVAEGVETEEQVAFLRANGCDTIQGYYFSKPMPLPEFIEYAKTMQIEND